jgi:hypothetical protein
MRLRLLDTAWRLPRAACLLADVPLPLIAFGMACSVGASTRADRGRAHRDSQEARPTAKRSERAIMAGT